MCNRINNVYNVTAAMKFIGVSAIVHDASKSFKVAEMFPISSHCLAESYQQSFGTKNDYSWVLKIEFSVK